MNWLPNEIIVNHIISCLSPYSKLQFGLVCRKFYGFVENTLKTEVEKRRRQLALQCEILRITSFYDHPLSGYAKTGDGKIVAFVLADSEPNEYASEQYPDYFTTQVRKWQDKTSSRLHLNSSWWSFQEKPDVSKFPADLFQDKDGMWNELEYWPKQDKPWVCWSYCLFDLYLVPDDWEDYRQLPENMEKDWKFYERRSEKYFTRSPDCHDYK